jgi:hypothetical protein
MVLLGKSGIQEIFDVFCCIASDAADEHWWLFFVCHKGMPNLFF